MPRPRILPCRSSGGVNAERPASGFVLLADHQPDPDRLLFRQDKRGLQSEFVQPIAPDVIARPQRQLHERRPRQKCRAHDTVIRQPWMGPQRNHASQNNTGGIRQGHRRTQQRVAGARQPDRRQIGLADAGFQPETPALEGIGRQFHPPSGIAEHGLPVNSDTVHKGLSQRGEQCLYLRPVPPQDRRGDDRVSNALVGHRGQGTVRAELHERRDTLIPQASNAVHEPH
jgi:hypothetical protein